MSYTLKTPTIITTEHDFYGQKLTISTGLMAPNADAAVRVKLGETEVLVTTVMNRNPNPNKDFLPLSIDFRDYNAAVGKIWGGAYRKREWRPTELMTLYGRIVDRTLRPMFPKGMINDIVVTITPLSCDRETDLAILGILWGSLTTLMAGIPFDGPVSGVRVWFTHAIQDNQTSITPNLLKINPTNPEFDLNGFNLLVSGKSGSLNMIEMDGMEISETMMESAFNLAQKAMDELCMIQQEFLAKAKETTKGWNMHGLDLTQFVMYNYPSDEVKAAVKGLVTDVDMDRFYQGTSDQWAALFHEYRERLRLWLADQMESDPHQYRWENIDGALQLQVKEYYRRLILDNGIRIDGRKMDEIRSLYCEHGLLSQVHGSALFWRGDTQILSTVTLGAPWDVQLVDDMLNDGVEQRFMHHYNFAPFSVNEAQKIRGTGNREIGHGKLAEKALEAVLPAKTEFPYTIRIVSECLSSGGSTSMWSVCASTMSLMDAWVPIRKPVSGIAMGLCSRTDESGLPIQHEVLIDIQWAEDHNCDMDFKVAGTPDGITAIQLDMKIRGITVDIAMEVIRKANIARMEIMWVMLQTISTHRPSLAPTVPKIKVIKIDADKVKLVIGKGGETIDKIIEETGVKIDFEDDGTCYITDRSDAAIERTIEIIMSIVYVPKVGDSFTGTVTRVEAYGAFVQYAPGKIWLMGSRGFPEGTNLATMFPIGSQVQVQIRNITPDGKVDLKKI